MKRKIIISVLCVCVMLSGCQKTPEKSAVVSKADGLSKDVIAEPLADGEKIAVDVPAHWTMNQKRSNDRVTISADLEIGKMEVGNLPVIEMSNHTISQKELEQLVSYFAKGEELYVPEKYTKEAYQEALDRIERKEGCYADASSLLFQQEVKKGLEKAVELASETKQEDEKIKVQFQKKIEDPALAASQSWSGNITEQSENAECYFSADVGSERDAYIEAECYEDKLGNSSSFRWRRVGGIRDVSTISQEREIQQYTKDAGLDGTGYTEKYFALLDQYDALFEQLPSIDEKEGQRQAEQVLKDLGISDRQFSKSEKLLWFPKGAYPESDYPGDPSDYEWQADLTKAVAGYQYTFSKYVGTLPAVQDNGAVLQETADSYIPPFPVETIMIVVTQDGVQSFSWRGITEEKQYIAENTKLLPFDTIEERLQEQIFYWYSMMGQPQDDPTLFNYNVTSAKLEYTYVPAYGNPKNAWLVPTWSFLVEQRADGNAPNPGVPQFVLNALDGGAIGDKL